jgi:hypothetical protein
VCTLRVGPRTLRMLARGRPVFTSFFSLAMAAYVISTVRIALLQLMLPSPQIQKMSFMSLHACLL